MGNSNIISYLETSYLDKTPVSSTHRVVESHSTVQYHRVTILYLDLFSHNKGLLCLTTAAIQQSCSTNMEGYQLVKSQLSHFLKMSKCWLRTTTTLSYLLSQDLLLFEHCCWQIVFEILISNQQARLQFMTNRWDTAFTIVKVIQPMTLPVAFKDSKIVSILERHCT